MRPLAPFALAVLVAIGGVAPAQAPKAPAYVPYPAALPISDRPSTGSGIVTPTPLAVALTRPTGGANGLRSDMLAPAGPVVLVLPDTGIGGLAGVVAQVREWEYYPVRAAAAHMTGGAVIVPYPSTVREPTLVPTCGGVPGVTPPGSSGLLVLGITDVVQFAKQGVSDDVIVNRIRQSQSTFSLSPADLAMLKENKVSDRVINEMILARYGWSDRFAYIPRAAD